MLRNIGMITLVSTNNIFIVNVIHFQVKPQSEERQSRSNHTHFLHLHDHRTVQQSARP